MHFGAHFLPAYTPELDGSPSEYYDYMFEQMSVLDDLGFDHIWVTEHHFHEYGGLIPDPPTFLAAVARSTKQIHLGVAVSVISFHNPLQLAESYAMVDVISKGRLELGLGRGNTLAEYDEFRISREDSPNRIRETAEIILQGWSGQSVEFDGELYQYHNVRVLPVPVQQPRPRIWIGASRTDKSYEWAGSKGFELMTLPYLYGPTHLEQCLGLYHDALVEAGHDPATKEILGKFHVYVAENRADVYEAVPYLNNYSAASAERNPTGNTPTRHANNLDAQIEAGNIIAGDPQRCIEIIKYWRDTYGFTTITGTFSFGGMPQEMALRNIRLFAEEVVPALED